MTDPRVFEALRRAEARVLGRSATARRAATDCVKSDGETSGLVRGFGVGPKVVGGATTADEAIRFLVAKKLLPPALAKRGLAPLPKKLGSLPTDVVAHVSAAATVAPGSATKHAVSGELGSLCCVLERGGVRVALSASHVVAPQNVFPNAGDDVWLGDAPRADLRAWTALAAFSTVVADVAVCDTSLAATDTWPDGAAFAGARDYVPANGPFTFFGWTSGTVSAAGQGILASGVSLDVSGVGPVTYAAHALLDAPSRGGDSGAGVRDAAGFLVGLVVGCTATAKACVTPWQSLGPAIDHLLA
jgi:hypothetical protein